jgi:hypothetical protein
VEAVRTHLFDQLTPDQVVALREISEAVATHLGGDGLWPLDDKPS